MVRAFITTEKPPGSRTGETTKGALIHPLKDEKQYIYQNLVMVRIGMMEYAVMENVFCFVVTMTKMMPSV